MRRAVSGGTGHFSEAGGSAYRRVRRSHRNTIRSSCEPRVSHRRGRVVRLNADRMGDAFEDGLRSGSTSERRISPMRTVGAMTISSSRLRPDLSVMELAHRSDRIRPRGTGAGTTEPPAANRFKSGVGNATVLMVIYTYAFEYSSQRFHDNNYETRYVWVYEGNTRWAVPGRW
jgi:hypothetical protein